jgi:Na+-transporting NADH:ubiquinone oxidoreductase subunit A
MRIRIKKGLDIPISGEPEQVVHDGPSVKSLGVVGADYVGLTPSMLVREGDHVNLGQALFTDRRHPEVRFTSPGSGVITAISRGQRRAFESIVIDLAGDRQESFTAYPAEQLAHLRSDQVVDNLLASGLWTSLRTRPYSRVPVPGSAPHSVFVTAMDTNPLAPRAELIIDEYRQDFANGLTVISHLTTGRVFLCTAVEADMRSGDVPKVSVVEFDGPHPAGLVGTHVHFLDPVGAGKTVWHVNYQDVIAIGRLFTTGRLWVERIVALAGPLVRRPRLARTRLGASTEDLVRGQIREGECRVVSGSILSGRRAAGPGAYLGRYHHQVVVMAEARSRARADWLPPHGEAFSVSGLTRPFVSHRRRYDLTTALHDRPASMLPTGNFERVLPLDILPTPLFRALLVGDSDRARALGCLCTFVCPGKNEYGPALRRALTDIEKQG